MRQVIINLLGNAVKFTPAGTVELRLRMRMAESGGFARLEVIDTGPGVWARHRDKLFRSFERLNARAVSGIEGAGVGLALAKRLVEAMNGHIGYADNPGGGSMFWTELPLSDEKLVAIDAATTADRATPQSCRLLVVDDDAVNRDIASSFLRLGGHEVMCLDNGAAAVEAVQTQHFDVVLMDVRMPGMDGLEATRRIRALPGPCCQVPVIALTAQAFAEQIEICRQSGMQTHVSKPFTHRALLAAVAEAVSTRAFHAISAPVVVADDHSDEVPLFDRAAFLDSTVCLAPQVVVELLQSLIAGGETLLSGLRAPGIPARAGELAEAAHRLAGGAGLFGCLLLSHIARRFEIAAQSDAAETELLASEFASAIDATIAIIRTELAETTDAMGMHPLLA